MGKYDDLERLQKLKEDGVLTEEEFDIEKAKILNSDGVSYNNSVSSTQTDISNNKNILEIKGSFPIAESKIQLNFEDGEQIILQHPGIITGRVAINGYITLTNRRILFNTSTSKNALVDGAIMVLATKNKNEEIRFSQIISITPQKYLAGSAGLEIVTTDGYKHKYVLQSMNMLNKEPITQRDMIVKLVKEVINSK